MTFGKVFKSLRENRKMTQGELAKALGISRSTVGMYEQGKREPDFETEEKIADFFNVSLDYLRNGDETPKKITAIFRKQPHMSDLFSGPEAIIDRVHGQSDWYIDPETAKMAQEVFSDPDTRMLFDAARDAKPEDIRLAAEMLKRMKETNRDG